MIKINAEAVRTYFQNMEIACNCWQETPDNSHPSHVAVSGWVLFPLAELNFPATESGNRRLPNAGIALYSVSISRSAAVFAQLSEWRGNAYTR